MRMVYSTGELPLSVFSIFLLILRKSVEYRQMTLKTIEGLMAPTPPFVPMALSNG